MKYFTSIFLNILFFTVIAILAVSIATIALTKKVNDYREQHTQEITGTVVKQIVPILSLSKGIVQSIEITTGDTVTKDDMLITVDNPLLRSKVDSLKSFEDNVSAQTEATVAEEELNNLTIVSPVNGVVGEIFVTVGSPIDGLAKTLEIYSSDNVKLLVELTVEQYHNVQKLQKIRAYSPRLNQSFPVTIEKLRPEETDQKETNEKKIGLYFTFVNEDDAASLLHNEDMILLTSNQEQVAKPIDFFVNFWNTLLYQEK